MSFTINDQPLSYYGIADIVFDFATMRADTATCLLSKNWDENGPSFLGQWVEIKRYGTRVFYGLARNFIRNASTTDQHLSIVVNGPWQNMEDGTYVEQYTYADGETRYTSRVILGGRTLTDQVVRILQTQSGLCTISGIDLPNITLPEEEVVDISIADALRRVLRWAPGCIVYFNYERTSGFGTNLARINVRKRWSATLNLRTVKTGGADGLYSFSVTEDKFPSISGVQINYELPVVKVDDTTGEEQSTYAIVATDTGGTYRRNSSHSISKTVKLAGKRTDTTYKYTLTSSAGNKNADYYLLNDQNLYNYCASQFVNHPNWDYADVSRYMMIWSWGSMTGHYRDDASKIIWLGQNDVLPNENLRFSSDDFSDGIVLWNYNILVGWENIITHDYWYKDFIAYAFDTYNRQGNINRYGQTIQNEVQVYDEDTETPPTGAAAQFYNDLQDHKYSGRVTFTGKSSWFFNGWTNYLSLRTPSNVEKAHGQIQSINIKAANDFTTVQFGVPAHLDFSSLLRLARIT
ncbi:MAG: hypothetical protein EOM20_16045 [Spartobacteria bacterium]|nr:hypothetical protein [Spartobacteria bacterium]